MLWGVENSTHWVPDMVFFEDESGREWRTPTENIALVRKFALNLIKIGPNKRLGIKNKCFKAGWNQEYLLKVIMNRE